MLCLHECFDGIGVLPKREFKKKFNQKYAKFSSFLNQAGREEEKNHAVWEEMRCQNLKGKK